MPSAYPIRLQTFHYDIANRCMTGSLQLSQVCDPILQQLFAEQVPNGDISMIPRIILEVDECFRVHVGSNCTRYGVSYSDQLTRDQIRSDASDKLAIRWGNHCNTPKWIADSRYQIFAQTRTEVKRLVLRKSREKTTIDGEDGSDGEGGSTWAASISEQRQSSVEAAKASLENLMNDANLTDAEEDVIRLLHFSDPLPSKFLPLSTELQELEAKKPGSTHPVVTQAIAAKLFKPPISVYTLQHHRREALKKLRRASER